MKFGTLIALSATLALPPALAAADGLARLQAANGQTLKVFQPADRSTPRVLSGLALRLPGSSPSARAQAFCADHRDLLLPQDDLSQLIVRREIRGPLGVSVQLEQRVDGLRVYGKSMVLAFDDQDRLRTVTSGLRPLAGVRRHEALLPAAAAAELAAAALSGSGRRPQPAQVETIWLQQGDELIRAQLVTVVASGPLGEYVYLIIGQPGRIVAAFRRSPMAAGYAYPSNPIRDATWQQVDLPYLSSATGLTGDHVDVWNCAGSTSDSCDNKQKLAAPDQNGDYLIEPTGANDPNEPDDIFGEVQAYFGINVIRDYFVSIGASPSPIQIGVNYPLPYSMGPNAFYMSQNQEMGGPSVMMGQWTSVDLALDNDVIFHEYGHHVFGEYSQAAFFDMDAYGPVFWGLAFSESTGDYFSCSALDDPVMGEYMASRLPSMFPEGYLRMIDNDLTCPRGLYGEGHDDGVIWSGFIWELRQLLGAENVDPVALDTIINFPTDIDFPTATATFLARAELVFDAPTMAQIEAVAEARGVVDCERFIEITRQQHTGFAYGKDLLGQYGSMLPFVPGELHYYIELPENADQFELHFSVPAAADMALLVRAGTPVQHAFSYISGLTSTYDFILEEGGIFDLTDPSGTFQPGVTYYFHPVNQGGPAAEFGMQGGYSTTEPDGGSDADGGTDPDGGSDADGGIDPDGGDCPAGTEPAVWEGQAVCVPVCKSGFRPAFLDGDWVCSKRSDSCGCAAAGSAEGLLPLGLLLGLSLFWRRSRRRG